MANYDRTVLETNNPEIFKTIIERFEKMPHAGRDDWYWNNNQLLALGAGDKGITVTDYYKLPPDVQKSYLNAISDIHIKTRNGVFHDEALELSKQFPGEKIICKYTFEHDWHFVETTVEYLDGKDAVIGRAYRPALATNYDLSKIIGESESHAVINKAHEFVMALYDNEIFQEGETVTFEFVHDNHKFEITIPFGPHYEITVYKGQEINKTEWQEVNPDDILPF